jgi:hypothetical protein
VRHIFPIVFSYDVLKQGFTSVSHSAALVPRAIIVWRDHLSHCRVLLATIAQSVPSMTLSSLARRALRAL